MIIKRLCCIVLVFFFECPANVTFAQNEDVDAEEAIIRGNLIRMANMDDGMYKFIVNGGYQVNENGKTYDVYGKAPKINKIKIEQTAQRAYYQNCHNQQQAKRVTSNAPTGIQFTYDNGSYPNIDVNAYRRQKAKEQNYKARRDAARHAFFERKRAEAARARYLAEIERKRKEQERKMIAKKILASELRKNFSKYIRQQAIINSRMKAGGEKMMNYRVVDVMPSEYIPGAKSVSPSDIINVISKKGQGSHSTITLLNEHAVPNTGQPVYYNFDAVFDSLKRYEMERKKRRNSIPDYAVWKQLGSQLEDGQRAFINSMIIDKNGYLPNYIGFKNDYYIFRSNDGKKIFKISPEGDVIFEYEFKDKFWNEENIVNKIKDGSIKQYLEESYNLKYNEVNPVINLDNLAQNGLKELTSLAPKIKADLQMVIIDRSRTKTSRGYYIPESVDFPLPSSVSLPMVGSVGLPTSVNLVFGYSASASSGRETTINGSANASLSGVGAGAGIKFSDAELNGKVQQGAVITCGKKQYWVSFDASGSIGAGGAVGANASLSLEEGVGTKVKLGFPIYLGAGTKVVFKDLSPKDEFDE